jgi:hypothetical protein
MKGKRNRGRPPPPAQQQQQQPARRPPAGSDPPPAGERTGEGADSVRPYLEIGRKVKGPTSSNGTGGRRPR